MQTISKLFAELGFTVNTKGLKDFQALLKAEAQAVKTQIQQQRLKTQTINSEIAAHRLLVAQRKEDERQEARSLRDRSRKYRDFAANVAKTAAAVYAATKFIGSSISNAFVYRDFARTTGLPVEQLQQYQAAGNIVGSRLTSAQIAQDIAKLQQSLVNVEFGQGNLFPYKMLGISAATKNPFQVIEALRRSIQGLDDARATNFIERIGLSKDWLYILRQSREEFEKLRAVMLSTDQIGKVTRMGLSFRQLGFSLGNLKDQFTAFISAPLSTFITHFITLADTMAEWLKTITDSPEALRILAAVLTLISLKMAPLTTLFAGLYLLLEDMYVASKGGKSLFAWDPETFDKVIDSLSTLAGWFIKILDTIISIISGIIKIAQFVDKVTGEATSEQERKYGKDWAKKATTPKEAWSYIMGSAPTLAEQSMARTITQNALSSAGMLNYTPMSSGIVNNFSLNGLSPEQAGQYVSTINSSQVQRLDMQSDLNTTYPAMSFIGG